MTNKIKLFIGFLGLVALFSVFNFFNSFGNSSSTFLKPLTGSVLEAVDQDDDKDGLANREESYWNTDFQNPDTDGDGFLDGEEVASGHDPLKPGPNDQLNNNKNITAGLTELITAGIYAQDLKPGVDDKKYDQAVSDLSLAVMIDFYGTQTDHNNISLNLVNGSKDSQKIYLGILAKSIKENILDFPEKINTNKSPDQQPEFFLNKSQQYRKSYDDLSKIQVPKNWEAIHRAILNILNRLAVNYIFIGSYEIDPIKGFLAVNEVQQNIEPEIKFLLQEIQSNIKQNKLSLNSDFFQVLNLIYK